MEKIELILTDCIQEIRSGRSTLAECLERYPSRRQELVPLLKMACNIQAPPAFQLEKNYKQDSKARLLQQIRITGQSSSRSISDIFSFGLPSQFARARIALAVLVGIIVISLIGGGTAYASQSSLPGEILYPIKSGTENFRLWMASNNAEKANLDLKFSQTRLAEMSKLADRNSDKIFLALNGYRDYLQAAVNDIQGITDSSILTNTLMAFSLRLKDQILFCDQVIDTNPASSESFWQTSDMAVTRQIEILNRLAQQDSLQAVRGNLDMMQDRLQRAQAKANEHRYQLMQESLLQYQKFNQLDLKILQNAQSGQNQVTEIDNLSAVTAQSCLGTLDILLQLAPQEYRDTVQNSQTLTLQLQIQAQHQYQNQGVPIQEPNQPPIGKGSGSPVEQGPQPGSQPQENTDSEGSNSPTPTPNSGGNVENVNGNTSGNTNSGTENVNGPNATVTPAPNTGNTENGSGTSSGSSSGTGKGSSSTSGNTGGSTGGSKR